jgi:hypothetical protein
MLGVEQSEPGFPGTVPTNTGANMPASTSRPTRRWVRLLASLAVATAGLTTAAGAIGPATPASACCFEGRHPDEEGFEVVDRGGIGNYDYIYDSGRVREYRNFTFVRQYYR